VDEAFTSKVCPVCGKPHEEARFVRGLFKCPATGLIFNADLVGAFNILKKAIKTITPNLGGLLAQGRGNGGKTLPEGLKAHFLVGLNEAPQTSPPSLEPSQRGRRSVDPSDLTKNDLRSWCMII
ncbi:zinc ribbon domain-containing protein, partial [Palaeococcus sp. (in: euryarchaeotes)]|uniref:zinc ribbon domain-containing protein n=1 Tax=Palaeococcus sp. (in: euryarchaeotes) TaxID=2820298 RepID=UPI0025D36EE3